MKLKKGFFGVLNRINKKVLPSYKTKDPLKLTKTQKIITGYRYWILLQSLD
ncbi:MAG: hypothetical protein ACFCUU_02855 [Cyclobacteriaceae bacterium]